MTFQRLTVVCHGIAGLAVMIALSGCASGSLPPPPRPDPQPDHLKLISENISTLFSTNANPRGIMVSELRRVSTADGDAWAACLKAHATGMSGRPTDQRTIVVIFRRHAIIERRPADPEDCADAKYAPLPAARQVR